MGELDYYPAGSYYDPRAPWNEPDPNMYDDEVYKIIDNEIDNNDCLYLEWLEENILAKEFTDEQLNDIASQLADVKSIREMYEEYRYENARDSYIEHLCPEEPDEEPDFE